MQALLELDCIPAGMELFPAADEDQWTLIKRVIEDCDYYIVIVAGRYGSIGPDGNSFTQMEYEYAIHLGKPVMAFLHKEPGRLSAERTDRDAKASRKLKDFRALTQRKMVNYWTSSHDLGSVVSRSLIKLITTRPAVGWVKADVLASKDATEEILSLRKKVESLEQDLLDARNLAPQGTENLAQGDDPTLLAFSFRVGSTPYNTRVPACWNHIFAHISPLMIDEATDVELRNALNGLVYELSIRAINAKIKEELCDNFEMADKDYKVVMVQLIALGLIKKSDRPRSVNDTNSYLTLTPYGHSVMTQLIAVRRPSASNLTLQPTPGIAASSS